MSKLSIATPTAECEVLSEGSLAAEAQALASSRSAVRNTRRRLITNLGMAAGAAGLLGVAGCSSAGPVAVPPATTGPSVADVLNFALNLEYFEASFYSYIVTGSGLSAADMGSSPGAVTGGAKVTFSNSFVANIAANLATEEVQHVEFLRATIAAVGGTPVAMPALNLAALGSVTNDATFLALARTIEGVGVSAYIGGAQYLTSNITALNYAAQILDVEAQHAGALRQACIQLGVSSPAADSLDQPPTATQVFNTGNTTGLNPVRTISQVLQIVYAAAGQTGVTKGGFFPNGLNGNVYIS